MQNAGIKYNAVQQAESAHCSAGFKMAFLSCPLFFFMPSDCETTVDFFP